MTRTRSRARRAPRGEHRPGRVGGAGHDEPLDRLVERLEHLHGRLEARGGAGGEPDHLAAEGGQHVVVAGVARSGDGHAVTGVEGREEGQLETRPTTPSSRRCRRSLRRGRTPYGGARRSPRGARDAQRHRVAEHLRVDGLLRGLPDRRGAGVDGWPATRFSRSPWLRCRAAAAASRSMTWKGGTFARLATFSIRSR